MDSFSESLRTYHRHKDLKVTPGVRLDGDPKGPVQSELCKNRSVCLLSACPASEGGPGLPTGAFLRECARLTAMEEPPGGWAEPPLG